MELRRARSSKPSASPRAVSFQLYLQRNLEPKGAVQAKKAGSLKVHGLLRCPAGGFPGLDRRARAARAAVAAAAHAHSAHAGAWVQGLAGQGSSC